jgi:hypothetical protein
MDTAGVGIGSLKSAAAVIAAAAEPWPTAAVLRTVVEQHVEELECIAAGEPRRAVTVLFLAQRVRAPMLGTLPRVQALHMQHLMQQLLTPARPIRPHLKAAAEVMVAAADMKVEDMKAADTGSPQLQNPT